MSEQDIVERTAAIMYRDDCLDAMVPSDIRQLVGRIERLKAELAAEKEAREKAEAMFAQGMELAARILDIEAAEHEEVSEGDEWHTKQGRMLRRLAGVIRSVAGGV